MATRKTPHKGNGELLPANALDKAALEHCERILSGGMSRSLSFVSPLLSPKDHGRDAADRPPHEFKWTA
jgi:hypothetical protein